MKIAVLGCGNMGAAVIAGLHAKYGARASITVYDKRKTATTRLPRWARVSTPGRWFKGKGIPDVVLIAVKPQDMETALTGLKEAAGGKLPASVLWLSIAAGVSLVKLTKILGKSARICRAMPNTPALIGEGITAYALNVKCGRGDKKLAEAVLGSFSVVTRVPEKMMNAVTGLSGSGPAYVYQFVEALIEGGVAAGLTQNVARQCAVQTVLGAAKMVAGSKESPAVLTSRVKSPGGTTERGLMELDKHGFKKSVVHAVTGAAQRSAELGKQ